MTETASAEAQAPAESNGPPPGDAAPVPTRDRILFATAELFRRQGYNGTGLKQVVAEADAPFGSLYHHFPGGKADMGAQVLDRLEAILEAALFEPLRSDRSPVAKLGAMLDAIASFYEDGRLACLLERLAASVDRRSFRRPLARAFEKWIGAVEELASAAGLPPALARARAEDLVVRVEGALVVAAGSGDTKVFTRTLAALRSSLLART